MKKTFLFLVLFVSFLGLNATNYFVDATGGNDSNNGLSPASAWQTIDKVNDQTFSAGDIILFKRGEIWTGEQLEVYNWNGTETNLITFGAYPETGGANPIISTIIEHSHTWVNQGGNIWKASNPPALHPERFFVDGNEILRANNMTELDGVNFLWLYDAPDNGDLYLYSTTDPSTKQISYTYGDAPIYIENANFIVFTNLDFQGGWTSVFINSNTSYIHFNNDNIGKYASNGVTINSENTSVPNHIHIKNCTFDTDFTLDYSMAGTYTGSDDRGCSDAVFIQNAEYSEIDSNYFKNWGHASINIDGNPYGGASYKVSYISVHHNYMTSPDICYGGRVAVDDAHHCEIFDNEIIGTSVQSQFGGENNHIHHNIFYGTSNPPIIDDADEISAGISVEAYSNGDIMNNIIENNLIMNTEGAGIQILTSGDYDIHDNIFRNNIIYNCGSVGVMVGIGLYVEDNSVSSTTSNNLIYNNLIYNESENNTINFRETITDITGLNDFNLTSDYQIEENIAGNPLFVDENGADYHLLSTSPCIDAGTNALALFDFEDNAIPYNSTNPDIGIYEFQGVNSISKDFAKTIAVYPNPAVDYLLISNYKSVGVDDIFIYNSAGQSVVVDIISNRTIDVSNLETGIYFIKIISSDKIFTQKFIKK